jgi:hypothetical protein
VSSVRNGSRSHATHFTASTTPACRIGRGVLSNHSSMVDPCVCLSKADMLKLTQIAERLPGTAGEAHGNVHCTPLDGPKQRQFDGKKTLQRRSFCRLHHRVWACPSRARSFNYAGGAACAELQMQAGFKPHKNQQVSSPHREELPRCATHVRRRSCENHHHLTKTARWVRFASSIRVLVHTANTAAAQCHSRVFLDPSTLHV